MKKLNVLASGLLCFAALACSDDDSSSVPDNTNATAVFNNMKSGSWKITSFIEDGDDETAHFAGYNFSFNENGVLKAVNGATTLSGTWSVTDSNNSGDDDNSNSNDVDFNIMFTSPDDFTDLTDDWDVLERTGTVLKLVDISGGNGGTDYLTFTKN